MRPVGTDVVDFFQRLYRYLGGLIAGMDEEILAWRPVEDTTPISNLVLHMVNSTRVGFTVVAGAPEERDREAEFAAAPLSAVELVERIDAAARELDRYRDSLTVDDLLTIRPRPARGQAWSGIQVLLNGYGHLTEHLAQIELTRQLYEQRRERP